MSTCTCSFECGVFPVILLASNASIINCILSLVGRWARSHSSNSPAAVRSHLFPEHSILWFWNQSLGHTYWPWRTGKLIIHVHTHIHVGSQRRIRTEMCCVLGDVLWSKFASHSSCAAPNQKRELSNSGAVIWYIHVVWKLLVRKLCLTWFFFYLCLTIVFF